MLRKSGMSRLTEHERISIAREAIDAIFGIPQEQKEIIDKYFPVKERCQNRAKMVYK